MTYIPQNQDDNNKLVAAQLASAVFNWEGPATNDSTIHARADALLKAYKYILQKVAQ